MTIELIESKIGEFEEIVDHLENHMRNLQSQLDNKPDNDLFEILREDKLSMKDFDSMLPGYLS